MKKKFKIFFLLKIFPEKSSWKTFRKKLSGQNFPEQNFPQKTFREKLSSLPFQKILKSIFKKLSAIFLK